MKMGIGTAQFGMDYGVANRNGKASAEEIASILKFACEKRIEYIDTACLYGDSEAALGLALPECHSFRIITKTPHFETSQINVGDAAKLRSTFTESLIRLRQKSIYALLLHNANDLLKPGGEILFNEMLDLKKSRKVLKIGVSVYTGRQIDAISDRFEIDIIQLPINIFDQRLLKSGHLERLKSKGIEIHSRSAFLQGLLLLTGEKLPIYLSEYQQILDNYHARLKQSGISSLQAALWFLSGIREVDCVICGVESCCQLEELYSLSSSPGVFADYSEFAVDDERLVDPSLWKKN